jgi:mercuric ion transport protein
MTGVNDKNSMQDLSCTVEAGQETSPKWLAFGGILGALGASTCCILPLGLTLLGISGAWMGNLRAMAPYQPFFILLAMSSIGYGLYRVYRKPVCDEGKACARPINGNIVKISLWAGSTLVIAALTFPLWFPLIMPYLP